jgi:hypothetical protein
MRPTMCAELDSCISSLAEIILGTRNLRRAVIYDEQNVTYVTKYPNTTCVGREKSCRTCLKISTHKVPPRAERYICENTVVGREQYCRTCLISTRGILLGITDTFLFLLICVQVTWSVIHYIHNSNFFVRHPTIITSKYIFSICIFYGWLQILLHIRNKCAFYKIAYANSHFLILCIDI